MTELRGNTADIQFCVGMFSVENVAVQTPLLWDKPLRKIGLGSLECQGNHSFSSSW